MQIKSKRQKVLLNGGFLIKVVCKDGIGDGESFGRTAQGNSSRGKLYFKTLILITTTIVITI